MKNLSGAPLYGRLLASPTKIRLGWKGLTNNLAYFENYGRKMFYRIGLKITFKIRLGWSTLAAKVIKLFLFRGRNKLERFSLASLSTLV